MKIDSNCKAIIESMNWHELTAYEDFLVEEIERHQKETKRLVKNNRWWRHWTKPVINDYYTTSLKLYQTAIYRHRKDIKSTRECILRAEDRMEMLEFLQ